MVTLPTDMPLRIDLLSDKIISFCQRWKIVEFALFGSVLRSDFRPDSDIDVLVTFGSNSHRSLADHSAMQEQIEAIFGRRVDLINRRTIEQSRNYLRRNAILQSARTIYAA